MTCSAMLALASSASRAGLQFSGYHRGCGHPRGRREKEMMAEGFASDADVERWAEAFARLDAAEQRPWIFPATFVAIGRRG